MQVAEAVQGMVEQGQKEAVAELLAELAHSALSLACITLVHLVAQASLTFLELNVF